MAGAGLLTANALLLEPNHPTLDRVPLILPRLPERFDGLTIAHLSDFHYDPYFSVHPIAAAVRMVNVLHPDIVVLTGDFVTMPVVRHKHMDREAARASQPCAEILRGLRSRLGVYAVMGNHDEAADPDRISDDLTAAGIRVLRNQAVPVERDGSRIWIAGVGDVLLLQALPEIALLGIPQDEFVLMLAHEPDFADYLAKLPVDLQLSGHSHGGQIRIPLLGAPWLPDLGRKYPYGWYRIGKLQLYTNRGIGTIRFPARWNCPPEVTLFTLKRG